MEKHQFHKEKETLDFFKLFDENDNTYWTIYSEF